jgi:hypothetical protein
MAARAGPTNTWGETAMQKPTPSGAFGPDAAYHMAPVPA